MTPDDPESPQQRREADAAEYVLGTLPADERAAFEHALTEDADLRARVTAWEGRLGALTLAVPAVEPPPYLWTRIAAAVGIDPAPDPVRPAVVGREPGRNDAALALAATVAGLRRSLFRWRMIGGAGVATVAALAVLLLMTFRLGPPPASTVLLAVLQPTGTGPAWLVETQPGARARILPINSPAPPAGRAFELWAIPGANAAPISMGVLRPASPNVVALPPAVAERLGGGVALAVSVEPPGGSPTGAPTGPVVYSGSLMVLPQQL